MNNIFILYLQTVDFYLRFLCKSPTSEYFSYKKQWETHRNKNFSSQENDVIFHIFDQIKFKGIIVIEHCHLWMEGHIKFAYSPFKKLNVYLESPSASAVELLMDSTILCLTFFKTISRLLPKR